MKKTILALLVFGFTSPVMAATVGDQTVYVGRNGKGPLKEITRTVEKIKRDNYAELNKITIRETTKVISTGNVSSQIVVENLIDYEDREDVFGSCKELGGKREMLTVKAGEFMVCHFSKNGSENGAPYVVDVYYSEENLVPSALVKHNVRYPSTGKEESYELVSFSKGKGLRE